MHYLTHILPYGDLNDGLVYGAMLELMVDRSRGTTVNHQWVQNEEAVIITGLYIHAINVSDLFKKNYKGWYRIHDEVLTAMREDRSKGTAIATSSGMQQANPGNYSQ